jgi:glycosyltransferase involved in cell wall biosynthesis
MEKISIFSIVKDEEEMCREAWESVCDADELVICIDDRTTDNTEKIAREFTDKIHFFKWSDSFADAKNFAVNKCSNKWVMGIDGDCVLKTGIESISKAINTTKADIINTTLHPIGMEGVRHIIPKIFNKEKVKFEGMAHEHLIKIDKDVIKDTRDYNIVIEYDYSPNHAKDPDRYIRILKKAVQREPNKARWRYYYAREFYYKKRYKEAIEEFHKYISMSSFMAERADAELYLARMYWSIAEGDKARKHCVNAITINPNFKEAFLFMANIVWDKHKQRWLDMAEGANNKEVLFIRRY